MISHYSMEYSTLPQHDGPPLNMILASQPNLKHAITIQFLKNPQHNAMLFEKFPQPESQDEYQKASTALQKVASRFEDYGHQHEFGPDEGKKSINQIQITHRGEILVQCQCY